jgi:4-amino-4-deoxy-L-arabinose transferase-like glycosyltransferase
MMMRLMAAISPVALLQGALFQYVAFDSLWSVAIAWLVMRMIRTGDARLWIPIGLLIGLGAMTRYTMAFFVAGLVVAVFVTPLRSHLRSPWLWAGAAISIVIFVPNLLWQIRNDWVSLEFLRSIHARDVRIGRADGFLVEQLFVPASAFTIPWWVAGLWFCIRSRFRPISWMFIVPLLLFIVTKGRSYYMAPAYPMLLAAGALVWERSGRFRALAMVAVLLGAVMGAALMLPLPPVNSTLFRAAARVHDNFVEEIGWPELVATVADVYRRNPGAAIFASNYGEAGAINLYGPSHGLPTAISGVNSHWQRGYGARPPENVILVGVRKEDADRAFRECEVAGLIRNRYGIENEEHGRQIVLCRDPRAPWPELWKQARSFG